MLALVICTHNRSEILLRCLNSIFAGTVLPNEVIVSDDSLDNTTNRLICSSFPLVKYIVGPKRGLCANRNVAIKSAQSDYISLIDDDCVVGEVFVAKCYELINNSQLKQIWTGPIFEEGTIIIAGNTFFLGYFGKTISSIVENVNLNSNLFPRSAFDQINFDEKIVYGYEDMDVCAGLRSIGYSIKFIPDLINEHAPPRRSPDAKSIQEKNTEYARFYTSIKRYLMWDRSLFFLVCFLIFAPVHLSASLIKRGNLRRSCRPFVDIVLAYIEVNRTKGLLAK